LFPSLPFTSPSTKKKNPQVIGPSPLGRPEHRGKLKNRGYGAPTREKAEKKRPIGALDSPSELGRGKGIKILVRGGGENKCMKIQSGKISKGKKPESQF